MDIDAVYSMGLFDDVTILPQPAEDSTLEHPKVRAIHLPDSTPCFCTPRVCPTPAVA